MSQGRIEQIIYHIQTNEQMELSAKSRFDIETQLMAAVREATQEANRKAEDWYEAWFKEKYGDNPVRIYGKEVE